MKYLRVLIFVSTGITAHGQPTMTRLWESDKVSFPESVLYTEELLYVSLLDHYPLYEHGKGAIAKVGLDGKIINAKWIVGLDGPKGMSIKNGKLYVADISQIVVIDIQTGKIDHRILVPCSVGLNDLTIDDQGILYTSDPEQGTIYQIIKDKPEIYLSGYSGVNGLKAVGKELYFVASSDVFKVDDKKKLSSLSKFQPGADGLASLGDGNFLVTVYNGLIYYLDKAGKLRLILNSQSEKVSSADIEFNGKQKIVYVPTLSNNSIVAYQLR